jgi:hypothetical protein
VTEPELQVKTIKTAFRFPRRALIRYRFAVLREQMELAWSLRARNPRQWQRNYRAVQEMRREFGERLDRAILFGE